MPAYPSASRKWVEKVSLDTCPFILGYIAKYPWILDEVTLLAFFTDFAWLPRSTSTEIVISPIDASPHHARFEHRAGRKESPDALARASGLFGLVRKRSPQEDSRVRYARELPLSSCR